MKKDKQETIDAVETLTGIVKTIGDIFESQERMREIHGVLIIRITEAVVKLQLALGQLDEAKKLGEAFGMAAAVLNANRHIASEEE